MLLEGNDGPNDLVEMPTHVTPKLELEEVAADKMDFYDLPRTSVSLKTQCAEEDFGLLERKEHAATLIEPKRDNAIKIAFGATRGNALHVVKFSELTVKNSAGSRVEVLGNDIKNTALQWPEETSDLAQENRRIREKNEETLGDVQPYANGKVWMSLRIQLKANA
jgi:hypothetical protein